MPWPIRMTLLLAGFAILPYIYFCWKVLSAVPCLGLNPRPVLRWAIIGVACVLNLYPLLLLGGYILGGVDMVVRPLQEAHPVFDKLFTYPFWTGGIIVFQIVAPFLMLDLLKLPFWPIYKGHTPLWQGIEARIVLGMVVLMAVYVVGRIYSDTARVQVSDREWSIANLPAELDGLRIAHISDIHADARTDMARIEAYIERVNVLRPDIAIFTGDLITWGTEYIEIGAEMIGRIQTRYGIYACIGDHDYWTGREYVANGLKRHGIVVLEDEKTSVSVGSAKIDITGVTNIYSQHPRQKFLQSTEIPSQAGELSIFMTHQPSAWLVDFAGEQGHHLFLAGHTHGGQVVLRWPGITLAPVMRETPYLSRFYEAGRMLINVNNGLGLTLAPIRYQAPAEVTLIRIRRRFKKIF